MNARTLRTQWRAYAWAFYLAVTLAVMGLYLLVPPFAGSGPVINLLGLSAVVAIIAGIRIHRPKAKAAWWLIAAGQSLFVLGDIYTYSYDILADAEIGFPSIGDGLYLAVYPVLIAGMLLLVRRRSPRRDPAALIDALILTIGVGLFSWVFLIGPNLEASGLSPFATAVSVAYPVGDVLLLAALIRLAVDAGKRAPAFFLLVGSVVCLLATDSVYGYALLVGGYSGQLSFDAGWIMYLVLWGAAAMHPSMRTLEEPATQLRTRLTPIRLGLLAGACLIAPAISFVEGYGSRDVAVVTVASAVLFLLVVARMAGLVRQERRVISRERALRQVGTDLVAAADQQRIFLAAIAGLRRLLGDQASARVALYRDGGAVEIAAASEGFCWALERETAAWLRRPKPSSSWDSGTELPPAARIDLRLERGQNVAVVPLTIRASVRGLLIVSSPEEVSRDLSDSVRALALQVSLALEGASFAEDMHRRRNESRFRSLVAHSSDLITVLDAGGVVTYQSPSIESVLGYRVEDVEGTRFTSILGEADRSRLARIIAGDGSGGAEPHTIECTLHHHDGRALTFEVQHTDLMQDEQVGGIVLNSRDVSDRKAYEEQLAHQAFHDPVTGLPNRALFTDRVEHALLRAQRGFPDIAVMFIDLDDFKTVNDSLGHPAGDGVLREVARRLQLAIRDTDTVARFGGDEFAVMLEDVTDSADAADAAARILEQLDIPMQVEGKEVFPRASIGICLVNREDPAPDAAELLSNADVAMYMAKRDSRGSYRLFEPAMHERVVERLELRGDLERAVELEQFVLHYQPVVRLDGHAVLGVEALLRWHHPTRGAIQPGDFIPLAEETGLILPIGRWVLEAACIEGVRLSREFPRAVPLQMSVNLSARQVQSESIVDEVRHALERSGLPASSLVLEITESVMLADADFAVDRFLGLKALGVRLAIDDFGTGYSSLSYLSRFPIDILKIDRSFVRSGGSPALTAAVIALGASLELDVVAEGIELPEEEEALREMGCEIGQGFLLARPMTATALLEFLRSQPAAPADPARAASKRSARSRRSNGSGGAGAGGRSASNAAT